MAKKKGIGQIVTDLERKINDDYNSLIKLTVEGRAGVYESHGLELGVRPKHTAAGSSSGKNAPRTFVPKGLLDQ